MLKWSFQHGKSRCKQFPDVSQSVDSNEPTLEYIVIQKELDQDTAAKPELPSLPSNNTTVWDSLELN